MAIPITFEVGHTFINDTTRTLKSESVCAPPLHFLPHTKIEISTVRRSADRESVTGVDGVEESEPDTLKQNKTNQKLSLSPSLSLPGVWTKASERKPIDCVFEQYLASPRLARCLRLQRCSQFFISLSFVCYDLIRLTLSFFLLFWFLVSSTTATKILPSQTLSFDPKILNRLMRSS